MKKELSRGFLKKNEKNLNIRKGVNRGCSKMSDFGTATLDLEEKAAYRRFF